MIELNKSQAAYLNQIARTAGNCRQILKNIRNAADRDLTAAETGSIGDALDGRRFEELAGLRAELKATCRAAKWALTGIDPEDREDLVASALTASEGMFVALV